MELGNQMQEMSAAAQGYYKVVEENRKLYNMVQDLKGNIRVYYRVRPIFNSQMKGVIDYIGKDGSLFVVDPSKTYKDARKTFQFSQVFAPTATQDDVFKETQTTRLDIRTCSSEDDGLSLPDATMHSVNTTKDVLQLMEAGEVNRAVSSASTPKTAAGEKEKSEMSIRQSDGAKYMSYLKNFKKQQTTSC